MSLHPTIFIVYHCLSSVVKTQLLQSYTAHGICLNRSHSIGFTRIIFLYAIAILNCVAQTFCEHHTMQKSHDALVSNKQKKG